MSIAIPTNYTSVDGFDLYINTTCKELLGTLRRWDASWLYTLALPHHYNEVDLQLARIERNNAKLIDTIAEAQKTGFISQVERARRISGVVQDEEERAQDAAFEPAKWAKQPYNTHGYKAIEMAVFEYIKLITAKHYQHLCIRLRGLWLPSACTSRHQPCFSQRRNHP